MRLQKYSSPFILKNAALVAEYIGQDALRRTSTKRLLKDLVCTEKDVYEFGQAFEQPLFACEYAPGCYNSNLLAAVGEQGVIYLMFPDRREIALIKGHDNAVFDLKFHPSEKKFVTASGDQFACLRDLETGQLLAHFQGHTSSVKSAAFSPDDPNLLATGSRDGNVIIWDIRCSGKSTSHGGLQHRPANIIRSAHDPSPSPAISVRKKRKSKQSAPTSSTHTVTSVVFMEHQPRTLASAGASDGVIKYWDIRMHGSYNERVRPRPVESSVIPTSNGRTHGITSLALDGPRNRLFAVSADNSIYMYDTIHNATPLRKFNNPDYRCATFYIRAAVSPDGRFIASGSSDHSVYIWEVDATVDAPIKLPGHSQEVSGVSWSNVNHLELASCSDDSSVRVWRHNSRLASNLRSDTEFKPVTRMIAEEGVQQDYTYRPPIPPEFNPVVFDFDGKENKLDLDSIFGPSNISADGRVERTKSTGRKRTLMEYFS